MLHLLLEKLVGMVPLFRKLFVSLNSMKRIALFPGSFDPFTRGHEQLVESALRLFDKVVIAIGSNCAKSALLSIEQRRELIETLYKDDERVEVATYDTLTVDFARKVGATAVVRGVRSSIDFEFERNLDAVNRRLAPDVQTILLMTDAAYAHVSSSTVRELLAFGHSVEEYMPTKIDLSQYLK